MAKEINEFDIKVDDCVGEIRIADSVVANIAVIAAKEADGVADTVTTTANELMTKVGMKSTAKGVRVEISEESVSVDLALIMKYGYNIPSTCKMVQEKVKSAIESMTGLTVNDVNIRIAGMNIQ